MDLTHTGHSIVLWRLRSKKGDLRAFARETSFGVALGLELVDVDLIALHPKLSLEALVAHAERIYAGLLAEGWQSPPECGERNGER